MRKLNTQDVFRASRIINQLDIKEEIKKLDIEDKEEEQIGKDLFFIVFSNLYKAEKEFYAFIASVFQMEAEEIKMMAFDEWPGKIKELAEKNNI